MNENLQVSRQRCFHHSMREAVARCPECTRFYCRECVTEHEDRLLCATCLSKIAGPVSRHRTNLRPLAVFFQSTIGLLLLWMVFYYLGQILLAIPAQMHEGTTWTDFLK